MTSNNSMASDDSDVFYVEQSSSELSPQRHNTPNILNSIEISEQHTARMPSISSIASPEPRIFTIDDDSNEPMMPYGFGQQLPIVPPSLNDLNLPPNPFNILNTMAIVTQTQDNNEQYSPESPEPSLPSPISSPPMIVSAYNSWETPHTTTDDNTFYSEDEPRRVYWTSPLGETFESEDEPRRIYVLSPSPSLPPSPPHFFHFSYSYLSLAGNIIVYTPDQGTIREKYFNHIICQRKRMPTLAGNKHPSDHFFPHGPRFSHLSTGKSTVRSVGNGHQSGYSRADTINKKHKQKIKGISIQGINTIIQVKKQSKV